MHTHCSTFSKFACTLHPRLTFTPSYITVNPSTCESNTPFHSFLLFSWRSSAALICITIQNLHSSKETNCKPWLVWKEYNPNGINYIPIYSQHGIKQHVSKPKGAPAVELRPCKQCLCVYVLNWVNIPPSKCSYLELMDMLNQKQG